MKALYNYAHLLTLISKLCSGEQTNYLQLRLSTFRENLEYILYLISLNSGVFLFFNARYDRLTDTLPLTEMETIPTRQNVQFGITNC